LRRLFKLLLNKVSLGILIGIGLAIGGFTASEYTSTDHFCAACHIHPQATQTWKRSTHYDNPSGIQVHCVECHLPPGGFDYYWAKLGTGLRDVYGLLFKDEEDFNWEEKSQLDHAKHFTYKASCVACHANLFPLGLSRKGDEAHLYYSRNEEELRCINCHLHVGHHDPNADKTVPFGQPVKESRELFLSATTVDAFEDYVECIPGSAVSFEMIALPGGDFTLGSPESEAMRNLDEGPARKVRISPFWIGKVEVTWDEYEAFYEQTASEGRTDTRKELPEGVDALTGATPPYGNPDQGWGKGDRPAITMTHHAATVYCRWLSQVTGKRYRLPTEAEWEYACRGGTQGPYFFEGEADDYSEEGFWNSIFGADIEEISRYVVFLGSSRGKTHPPSKVSPNPFGLLNMSGNVREFCLDRYADGAYNRYAADSVTPDPRGPGEGEEHVIRGGSYKSDAARVRSAARDHTRTDAWLKTDPQMPKSIWWYSDCNDVGFRVVCEYDE
jgi:formylglycine-generating enzyme required for sulfatase activity/nitrate/TMAO reductase-like tetraheme cytochrome c subunit